MVVKRVKKWDDGDSGIFMDGTRFRLQSVRAPESHQFGGSTATRRAAGMTSQSNGWVSWNPVARDYYGRQVGEMRNADGSINKRLRGRGCDGKGR